MDMTAFTDEFLKIAGVGQVGEFLAQHGNKLKYPAVAGGGILAYIKGKEAVGDYRLGRAYRQQLEGRS